MEGKLRSMTAVYLARAGKILLLYRVGSRVGVPSWRGIGGHFEPTELSDARACALRELWEETGLREEDTENLRLRYVTLRLKDGEIRQNYYFFGELKHGVALPTACEEGTLAWFAQEALPDLKMPYTAEAVLRHYLAQGKREGGLFGGIAAEDGVTFTPLKEF